VKTNRSKLIKDSIIIKIIAIKDSNQTIIQIKDSIQTIIQIKGSIQAAVQIKDIKTDLSKNNKRSIKFS
jgi:hypothetical protein